MSILDTDTSEERADKAIIDWLVGPVKIQDASLIKFLGHFDSLPTPTIDMIGCIVMTNETEIYLAIQTNGGEMRWMRLEEPPIHQGPMFYNPLNIH